MNDPKYAGVMDGSYAIGRQRRPSLVFRYRTRAQVAVDALLSRGGGHAPWRVLDLGAAEGVTLLRIRELLGGTGEFHGIEYSQELLDAAPPLAPDTRLLRGDIMALPAELKADSYDLCTALAVLEHLPDPERAMAEALRMLRPGGVFVATCPNPFWDDLAGRFGLVQDEHHEQEMDGPRMQALARAVGFSEVASEPFMFAPIGFLPYLRVPVSPRLALKIDAAIHRVRALDFSFVNQALVARKPH